MLEILFIIILTNKNRANAVKRGRSPGVFTALTIGLWVGMEILGGIIGGAMELGIGTYLLALFMALLGGLISYLAAKNCKQGDYVPPKKTTLLDIAANNEPLDVPALITVVRDKSFVGCMAGWKIFLNGTEKGTLSNGGRISVETGYKKNMLVAVDSFGSELPPFVFDLTSGKAEIHFKVNRFILEESSGISAAGFVNNTDTAATFNTAAEGTGLLSFCRNCGTKFENDDRFCANCGAPRETISVSKAAAASDNINTVSQPVKKESRPGNVFILGVSLSVLWLCCLIFQVVGGIYLIYCNLAMEFLSMGVIATALYLMLKNEKKYRINAGILFGIFALLEIFNTAVASMTSYGIYSLEALKMVLFETRYSPFVFPIIEAAVLFIGGFFLAERFNDKPFKDALKKTALIAGGVHILVFICEMIPRMSYYFKDSYASLSFFSMLVSTVIDNVVIYFMVKAADMVANTYCGKIKLKAVGIIWSVLCVIGMVTGAILVLSSMDFSSSRMYSSQFMVCVAGALGYLLLLFRKKIGWFIVLFSSVLILSGEVIRPLVSIIFYHANVGTYVSMGLPALLGLLNPVIGWFCIKNSFNDDIALMEYSFDKQVSVNMPSLRPCSKAEKAFAITDLVIGFCAFFITLTALIAGDYLDEPEMYLTLIPSIFYIVFGIILVSNIKKGYKKWHRVINIGMFVFTVLFFVFLLIGLIVSLIG